MLADDLRNAHRPFFFRILAQDARDLLRAPCVDDLARGQRLILIHAHIQRRVGVIGKTALGGIELIAAHAEVDHHAVDLLHAALGEQRLNVVKIPLHGGKIARRAEPFRRRGKRVVVAVNAV